MVKGFVLVLALAGATAWADLLVKPDPQLTYGDLCSEQDTDYIEHRYVENIAYCYRNVSFERRARVYDRYNIPAHCRRQYTIDHFIPLALGGSNKDQNLWPEHRNVKATRQNLEQELFDQIRVGKITQTRAIEIIMSAKMDPPSVVPWACK
jgi:hypothetical protein